MPKPKKPPADLAKILDDVADQALERARAGEIRRIGPLKPLAVVAVERMEEILKANNDELARIKARALQLQADSRAVTQQTFDAIRADVGDPELPAGAKLEVVEEGESLFLAVVKG